MTFYQEEHSYSKTALSDLQGAWLNLREEVVKNHPFENSGRLLFHIDEAMSWESVNNLKHMGDVIVLIHNIAVRSKAPAGVVWGIKQVKEEFGAVLDDIDDGTIAFFPLWTRKNKSSRQVSCTRLSEVEQKKYTENSSLIDWRHPSIRECSQRILARSNGTHEYMKNVFAYVRDEIRHSRDFQIQIVTCSASEVLEHGSGSCYAKSHLLAALLRAQNIPVGFCYQRLSLDDNGPPYCLHGLNAVFIEKYNWYRVDARGNKEGVNARFTPPVEQLAFPVNEPEERDLPEIWSEPLPVIVQALQTYRTTDELYNNLPDVLMLPL